MARVVNELFPPTGKGPGRGLYPWEQWLNGQLWELVEGRDFSIAVKNFRTVVHGTAQRYGKKVVTTARGSTLWVRATEERTTPEAARTEPPPRRRSRYPWDQWFNGRVWELVEGRDFSSTVESFQISVLVNAQRYGKKVVTTRKGPFLRIKALVPRARAAEQPQECPECEWIPPDHRPDCSRPALSQPEAEFLAWTVAQLREIARRGVGEDLLQSTASMLIQAIRRGERTDKPRLLPQPPPTDGQQLVPVSSQRPSMPSSPSHVEK